jgi:glycosyltransferase involved in cell wall biosynthesis
MEKYAVIVTAYNDEELLPKCLAAINSQSAQPSLLIVVDDGSTDNTQAVLEGYNVIRVDEPKHAEGYKNRARAFNRGVDAAKAWENWRYLLKVDADIIMPTHYAETLLDAMEPRIGVASGVSSCYTNKRFISNGAIMYRREALGTAPMRYGWDRQVALDILRKGYDFMVVPNLVYEELRPPRVKAPPLWSVMRNRLELASILWLNKMKKR